MIQLRSIELNAPGAAQAAAFLTGAWGAASAGRNGASHYVRGSSSLPYLISLSEASTPSLASTTFTATTQEVADIALRAQGAGLRVEQTVSRDPGGGQGVLVQLPEGEVFRFLEGAQETEPLDGDDLPVRLSHVVLNSCDAEVTATATEAFGFRVSDRTRGMVFVRCNRSHHSVAFARAGYASLNHIAFEMQDLDAVMRGIGRMRDEKLAPAWGPGRHGPGANVFAYFVAPFGAVVEFSTAVETIADDHRAGDPQDWTWPRNRIDRWGTSDKDTAALATAERRFRHLSLEKNLTTSLPRTVAGP